MDTRRLLFFSLALSGLFLAAVLLRALFFVPAEGLRIAAAPVRQELQMQGRDAPDTKPVELLPGDRLDLNRAGEEELRMLPGIGEELARAIVEYRQQQGPFRLPEELMQVEGIGEGKYAVLADWIDIGDTP